MDYPISGRVAPGFERVRDVFAANFGDDVEVGAGFAVYRGNEPLVDLWGGFVDAEGSGPWEGETLVNVYSTTKGAAALAFALLVEDGLISYEDPVARHWPELLAGRNGLTVGQLLAHQGGLCGVSETITVEDLYDFDAMVRRLEAQTPYWEPGTAAGYHAIVWGYLPGELTRRLTGATLGHLLAERLAGPAKADFYLGLPASEDHRIAPMIAAHRAPWRRAESAAANGQASARGIARLYAHVVGSGSPFRPETLHALTRERVGMEKDLVLGRPVRRGAGVILNTLGGYGPNDASFGHSGAGGSIGFADPDRGLGVGYAMNQMQTNLDDDTRGGRLIRAVYDCLAEISI
jgi:CubicO group peptidase (beta-lactamase class C family)